MEEKMIKMIEKLKDSEYLKEIPKIFKKMEHNTRCEKIEELGHLLENEDYDTRLKALRVLSELSVPEILPPIIDALETVKFYEYDIKRICDKTSRKKQTREDNVQNQEFKDLAIKTLIKLRRPESVGMLMDLYEDQDDPKKQKIIIFILQELGNIGITELKRINECEEELDKIKLIIKIFGQIGSEEAMDELLNMIKVKKNKDLHKDIICALENFTSPTIASFLITSLREQNNTIVRLAAQGLKKYINIPEVHSHITKEIKQSNEREREEIIKSLGYLEDEAIIPILLESIKDNSRSVKIAVLESLKSIQYINSRNMVINCLLGLLQYEDIRWEILTVFEKLSPPEIKESLIKLLEEETAECRAMAKHGERNWECRKIIVKILGNMGNEDVIPVIIKAMDEKQYFNRLVKQQSWTILIEILSRIPSVEAIPYLIKSLQNDPSNLYNQSLYALIKLGEKAIPSLIESYKGNVLSRKRIMEVFCKTGDMRAKSLIIEALSDEDEDLRRLAVIALGKIECNERLSLFRESVKDKSPKVRATAIKTLWQTGEHVEPSIFIEALKDQKPTVRQTACEILGELKYMEARKALSQLLEDNYSEVREEAQKALEKIAV